MQTYQQAAEYLMRGRSKTCRPLTGRSTSLKRRDEHTIAVEYHETDVVTYHDDGTVTLNSGGWRTMTTKERMSTYSPVSVAQEQGIWYVARSWWHERSGKRVVGVLFADGITCTDEGEIINGQPVEANAGVEKIKRKLDRMTSKYIKGYIGHVATLGKLEEPGPGDCWPCLMVDDNTGEGDVMGYDHLLSHFEESYYVPSLFVTAMKASNWNNPGFIIHMINSNLEQGRTDPWHMLHTLRSYFRARKPQLLQLMLDREAYEKTGRFNEVEV